MHTLKLLDLSVEVQNFAVTSNSMKKEAQQIELLYENYDIVTFLHHSRI